MGRKKTLELSLKIARKNRVSHQEVWAKIRQLIPTRDERATRHSRRTQILYHAVPRRRKGFLGDPLNISYLVVRELTARNQYLPYLSNLRQQQLQHWYFFPYAHLQRFIGGPKMVVNPFMGLQNGQMALVL